MTTLHHVVLLKYAGMMEKLEMVAFIASCIGEQQR
jgi:hypothetical protein